VTHRAAYGLVVTTGKRADTVLEHMGRIEQFTLGRVCEGLTDDELFFEPVPNMWSVRRRGECTTDMPFGLGEWVVDFGRSNGTPEPMTTIAWLLWHIGSMPGRAVETELFGGPHAYSSGWTSPYLTHHEIFTTADRAVEVLGAGWASLRAAIEALDDDGFERRFARYTYARAPKPDGVLPIGEPGDRHTATFFAVSIVNEISHHGAQVCVLRDLYAHRR
jgi:hypothetical protein